MGMKRHHSRRFTIIYESIILRSLQTKLKLSWRGEISMVSKLRRRYINESFINLHIEKNDEKLARIGINVE